MMNKMLKISLFVCCLTVCLINVSNAQSIGTELENESIYNSNGLKIYYNIVYMGSGECGIKYKVTIFIENKGSDRINVGGSLVDVSNGFSPWESNYNQCNFQGQILFGSYPNYEKWKVIEPEFIDKNSHTVYMKASSKNLPKVSWNIVPKVVKD